jgi:CRISPR-associated protein Csm3
MNYLKQNGQWYRFLLGNVIISGIIDCKTGLHIGGSSDSLEIGGIDSVVIRNPLNHEPYIPGSSLKGKLRSIVEKTVSVQGRPLIAQRDGGDTNKKVWRHECDDFTQALACPLCRIFGSTGKASQYNNFPALIRVRDGHLANPEEMEDEGMPIFEAKMENALDRLTSAAHPRCIERVPAGAKFTFEIVYQVEKFGNNTEEDFESRNLSLAEQRSLNDDLTNLFNAMTILEYDGLGGNVSRGSGGIKFNISQIRGVKSDSTVSATVGIPDDQWISPETAGQHMEAFVNDYIQGCQ